MTAWKSYVPRKLDKNLFFGDRMKIAVPTRTEKGLRDTVAETFSRAPTFTIVTIKEGEIEDVKIIKNNAADISQGAGPLAARTLKENQVNMILSEDIGPGATYILETIEIDVKRVEPGQKVKEVITKWIKENKNS